jgi:hypothetical protein
MFGLCEFTFLLVSCYSIVIEPSNYESKYKNLPGWLLLLSDKQTRISFFLSQSLTNIPIFRCGRIRVSYESPQYLKANVVFDKEMPSYDYSVAIGIDSNVLDCTAIYYENRSVHGFGISIYKADANFTSVDGVNLSWIVAM